MAEPDATAVEISLDKPTVPNDLNDLGVGVELHIDIRELTFDEQHAAVILLADAMRDNPLHVQVFGADSARRERRLQHFLNPLVRHVLSHGILLGACAHGELVGVLGMMKPGGCRPTGLDALRFAGVIITSNPPGGVWRIGRWLTAWMRADPAEPHWHIGPLGVLPAYRRRGVARRLMVHCCRHIDTLAATAWLETDLAINANFYETLGFAVVRHKPVLGVPNWFMRRPSTAPPQRA